MQVPQFHRRTFLRQSGLGIGAAALSSLLARTAAASPNLITTHHAPKAKRVIFLYMAGGPSHLETFDYKPDLDRLDGQPMPASLTEGQPIAQLQGKPLTIQRHLASFHPRGQSGQLVSDFLPHQAAVADDLCVIRSMVTEQINHDPAHTFMNTGTIIGGRPSMGAWITYGLGAETDDLPGFIVLTSTGGRNPQPLSSRQWGAGFLPAQYQGVPFHAAGDPVHYVAPPKGVPAPLQQSLVQAVQSIDQTHATLTANPEVEARIAAYEMAFRMQASVPELTDLSDESQDTLKLYGATPGDGSFASNCLLARRLAERGVRFIQLYHRGWDHHDDLQRYMGISCGHTDRPTAALLTDLKRRGMLDDTLLIWGGEFGRTPMAQTNKGKPGRDHHIKGFSLWLAGGGAKPGTSYGQTDDLGYHAAEDPVHVRDLHATILHLLGIDPPRLSVPFQGLDARLTGVEPARVLHPIIT